MREGVVWMGVVEFWVEDAEDPKSSMKGARSLLDCAVSDAVVMCYRTTLADLLQVITLVQGKYW